jgi:MraZ protein
VRADSGNGEGLPDAFGVNIVGRGIYKGAALQLVDDKLRCAIPSSLRNTILANSPDGGSQVTIAVSPDRKCLMGYDLPWGIKLSEDLEALIAPASKDEVDHDYRREVVNGADFTFDASGRFVMDGFQKKKARIDKHAFFYGVGPHFEIWDPATLLATGKYELMRENLEYLLEEKGIVL